MTFLRRLIRRWRARRTYRTLCEAIEYSAARRAAFERWRAQ